jgi:hypothetical protein|uniref:Uncharacterized protein n=1 Tax=uncultured prokaryote TaxID=198431 RepID=A0A0H5QIF9_9ZZZZ|nr:hypothetical protein [uncultured prokaryote]
MRSGSSDPTGPLTAARIVELYGTSREVEIEPALVDKAAQRIGVAAVHSQDNAGRPVPAYPLVELAAIFAELDALLAGWRRRTRH